MRIPVVVVVLGMLGMVTAEREVRPGQLQEQTQYDGGHLMEEEDKSHEHHHKKPKQEECDLQTIWHTQKFNSFDWLKMAVCGKLKELFVSKWSVHLENISSCDIYLNFKTKFMMEKYLTQMTWIFLHQKLPLVRPNPKLVGPSEVYPKKFESEDDDDNFSHHHKNHPIELDPVPKPHLVEEEPDDHHEDRNEVEHHHKGDHHKGKHHHSGHHEKKDHVDEHVISSEALTTTRYLPEFPEEPMESTDRPEIYLEKAAVRDPIPRDPVVLSVTEGKTKQDYSGLPSILQPIIPGGGGSRFEDVERERLEEAKMSQVKEKLEDSDATSMGAESLSSGSLSIILSSSLLLQATLILQFPVFRIVL